MNKSVWDTTFADTATGATAAPNAPKVTPATADTPAPAIVAGQSGPFGMPTATQAPPVAAASNPDLEAFERWRRERAAIQQEGYYPPGRKWTPAEPLAGKKTYLWAAGWALVGGLVLVGVEIPGINISNAEAMNMIWEAGAFVFARLGISKIFKTNN